MHYIHQLSDWYFAKMDALGLKLFVFLGMFIESSFIPFPSEIIMPPAGHEAETIINLTALIFLGTFGSLCGAWINYGIGFFLGRPFLSKYGKFIFIKEKQMTKMDAFWDKYGEGSTFICRLIPAVRQLISIPAGMGKMNFFKFSLYTSLGAGIWVTVLALCGWFLRDWTLQDFETRLKGDMMPYLFVALITIIAGYVLYKRQTDKQQN